MGTQDKLRTLPSVDRLLRQPRVAALRDRLPHDAVVALVRDVLDDTRRRIAAGEPSGQRDLAAAIVDRSERLLRPTLRPVINATGVVLHTNLGRAPLSVAARAAMEQAATGYSNLEFELESGQRGSRHVHLHSVLADVTGAEAGLAVNNNAAGVLLVLAALARGKEVIVSRGQAVEIGGGFRIPEVLTESGARLVEVGTTNRTRPQDYERAIGPDTALLLRVHTSNFRIIGFTESVDIRTLVAVGRRHGVPVVDDVGSGCLLATSEFGIDVDLREPMVQESVAAGADLVCFSADKLLGGPQAGLIVGRQELIERLRAHPLVRALRLDKVTIAGLAATLQHYRLGEARRQIPVWRMIGASLDELRPRAAKWAEALRIAGLACEVVEAESAIGGGSLPGVTLPTAALRVTPDAPTHPQKVAARLRQFTPPVVCRIDRDRLLFDPRTVLEDEEEDLLAAIRHAAGPVTAG